MIKPTAARVQSQLSLSLFPPPPEFVNPLAAALVNNRLLNSIKTPQLHRFVAISDYDKLPGVYEKTVDCDPEHEKALLRRRARRAFHRCVSGLSKFSDAHARCRFLTLTSAPDAPDISQSWRTFSRKGRREGWLGEYYKVTELTQSGLKHLHVLFTGSYVSQAHVSSLWGRIHGASVVWIEVVSHTSGGRAGAAGYLSKYLGKAHSRMSMSRFWLRPGACKVWEQLKKIARSCNTYGEPTAVSMRSLIESFRYYLRTGNSPFYFFSLFGPAVMARRYLCYQGCIIDFTLKGGLNEE